jgi:hypothetical protein
LDIIPYHQHGIDCIFDTIKYRNEKERSLEDTKKFIGNKGISTDLPLENIQIHTFENRFLEAFIKLNSIVEIKNMIIISGCFHSQAPIRTVIDFIDVYQSISNLDASNIKRLCFDYFFHFQNGHLKDRQFLFGTASQKL